MSAPSISPLPSGARPLASRCRRARAICRSRFAVSERMVASDSLIGRLTCAGQGVWSAWPPIDVFGSTPVASAGLHGTGGSRLRPICRLAGDGGWYPKSCIFEYSSGCECGFVPSMPVASVSFLRKSAAKWLSGIRLLTFSRYMSSSPRPNCS